MFYWNIVTPMSDTESAAIQDNIHKANEPKHISSCAVFTVFSNRLTLASVNNLCKTFILPIFCNNLDKTGTDCSLNIS